MRKYIWTYGLISGAIIIGSIITGLLLSSDTSSMGASEWFGFLIMFLALGSIFVGIKRYRDQELGGVISFGKAFLLGLAISAVASLVYVVVWEIYLSVTDYSFIEVYTDSIIQARQEAGLEGAELEQVKEEMASMKEKYARPYFRIPITFIEIFPVGLLISLISAALLRKSSFMPAG